MRVAIVHDWLYVLGGAEKVLSAMLRCFPSADAYTVFDILPEQQREKSMLPRSRTTILQKMPALRRMHRSYLPLMPLAIEQIDFSKYDLIISSSHAVAKGIITGPDQLHVAYVHSPMRYAWDLQHQCLRDAGLDKGLKSWIARYILFKMRLWDARTAAGVDTYIANSNFVSRRIKKCYGRDATVIYPPVYVNKQLPIGDHLPSNQPPFFLAASRLVPYKNMHSVVEAFALMPDKRLIVAGDGPEAGRLRAIDAPNVTFAGFLPDPDLRRLMRNAKAFVFAAEEDFGIVPVEAQGEGTTVIALGRGGARETVITTGSTPTGMFFDSPQPGSIADAVRAFDEHPESFDRSACHTNALRFCADNFEREFKSKILWEYERFQARLNSDLPSVIVPSQDTEARHADTTLEIAGDVTMIESSFLQAASRSSFFSQETV